MSDARRELARLARATRGALEWHMENGEHHLSVPADFVVPELGTIALAPSTQSPAVAPSAPQPVGQESTPETDSNAPGPDLSLLEKLAAVGEATGASAGKPTGRVRKPAAPKSQAPTSVSSAPTAAPVVEAPAARVSADGSVARRLLLLGDGLESAHDGGLLFYDNGSGPPPPNEVAQLLGRMIKAMGLMREESTLTSAAEQDEAMNQLDQRIEEGQPEAIIALGEWAARLLCQRNDAFVRLRGQWFEYKGIPVMVTFHPQALIQYPASKAAVWKDLQLVMRRMKLSRPRG